MRHDHVEHVRGAAQEDDDERISAWSGVLRCEGQAWHPGFGWDLMKYG